MKVIRETFQRTLIVLGMRWRHIVALLLCGSLLTGCAVGPDYRTPLVELPTRWSSDKQKQPPKALSLSQWWHRLNDPLLNTLIEEAVEGNLDVATAKAKIREARAARRETLGSFFPSISGSGSATRNKTSANTLGGGSIELGVYNQFQAGFDASWELDIFGANRRNVEAATRAQEAANENLRSVLLTLIGDVAAYYVEARGYQVRVALAQRTAVSQRDTATLTRNKFEAGSASGVDVSKAQAQEHSTEANIPTYQAAYTQAVHRLGILLGRDPAALTQQLKRGGVIPAPRLPLPTGIPADILRTRPDVRMAERQLAQYTAKIGQAEAALYPSISLTGSVSTTGSKIGDLGKSSSIGWYFGPTLTVPIFNGGSLRAAVEVAQAQRDQYSIAFRSAVLTALEDVENAIVSLAQERIKAQRLSQAAQEYRNAARLSRSLYQTGSASFLDVLDAERSLYSAEDSLLQSRMSIAADYVALAKALGGGWDGLVNSSMPEVIDINTGPHIANFKNLYPIE